jgi:hypothetical protein
LAAWPSRSSTLACSGVGYFVGLLEYSCFGLPSRGHQPPFPVVTFNLERLSRWKSFLAGDASLIAWGRS